MISRTATTATATIRPVRPLTEMEKRGASAIQISLYEYSHTFVIPSGARNLLIARLERQLSGYFMPASEGLQCSGPTRRGNRYTPTPDEIGRASCRERV